MTCLCGMWPWKNAERLANGIDFSKLVCSIIHLKISSQDWALEFKKMRWKMQVFILCSLVGQWYSMFKCGSDSPDVGHLGDMVIKHIVRLVVRQANCYR